MSDFSLGRFVTEDWDHPGLLRAREQGDPEKVGHILAGLTRADGSVDTSNYVQTDRIVTPNLNADEGVKYAFDLITGVQANAGVSWYMAEFESDSNPGVDWTGDFGAVSGGDCTEFVEYDETGRPECVFTAADGTTKISATNPVKAQVTVSAGVSGRSIYGICLSTNPTKQYDGGAAVLLAATRYPAVRTYNAGEVKYLGYELYMP